MPSKLDGTWGMGLNRLRIGRRRSLTICARVCAPSLLVGFLAACGTKIDLPTALGNCVPKADASCSVGTPAFGSLLPPPEASTGQDLDASMGGLVDAAACGADLLGLSSSNSLCLQCLGQPACCGAVEACALDVMCQMRVQCAVGSGGGQGATGANQCLVPPDVTYVNLTECLANNCLPCGDLSRMLVPPGDR